MTFLDLDAIRVRATCQCHPADDDSGHCERGASSEETRALLAEVERLRVTIARVEALAAHWDVWDIEHWGHWQEGYGPGDAASDLRLALVDPEPTP